MDKAKSPFEELGDYLKDRASKTDVSRIVKTLIDFVKEAKVKLEEMMVAHTEEIDKKLQTVTATVSDIVSASETRSTERVDQNKETFLSEARTLMRYMQQEVARIEAAIPQKYDDTEVRGKVAESQKLILEETRKLIPPPREESAEDIRNKLELLEGEERLNVSAIEGLEDLLKRIEKVEKKPDTIINGGIIGRDLIKDIDLSSQLDGVTKTFQLPAVWNVVSVHLSSFPHALRKTVDFTYTPTSITFTSEIDAAVALATGQTCVLTVVSG